MYTVGEKVAHPMHSAGVIEQILPREEGGKERLFYLLRLCVGSMTLLLPCDSCGAVGLRPTVSREEAQNLLDRLGEIPVCQEGNWNQRYKDNMQRIRSGDLEQVAVVIRSLRRRDGQKNLSTGERKMLSSAKKILVSELALVLEQDYGQIEHIVEKTLV